MTGKAALKAREAALVARRALAECPESGLRMLDARSVYVVRRRGEGWKVTEIARDLGVSRERVVQIEERALGAMLATTRVAARNTPADFYRRERFGSFRAELER